MKSFKCVVIKIKLLYCNINLFVACEVFSLIFLSPSSQTDDTCAHKSKWVLCAHPCHDSGLIFAALFGNLFWELFQESVALSSASSLHGENKWGEGASLNLFDSPLIGVFLLFLIIFLLSLCALESFAWSEWVKNANIAKHSLQRTPEAQGCDTGGWVRMKKDGGSQKPQKCFKTP